MEIVFTLDKFAKIHSWKVKEGRRIFAGNIIFDYCECDEEGVETAPNVKLKFKSPQAGVVRGILVPEGAVIKKGTPLASVGKEEECKHPVIIDDMCGVCSADLRKLDEPPTSKASVAMVHSMPALKVSLEDAQLLGKLDEQHLTDKKVRKLVLLVDLDQTLIHTTNDNVPHNLEDVFHFQLRSHGSVWYHTRLRPGTKEFLGKMNKLFQLHICTFGTRQYANTIAMYLDPGRKFFSDRILSRDECFNPNSKTANLKELFPRGDHMVCIIDDREDVWSFAANLIHVKPYHFFRHTGDINAPPGLAKIDNDDKTGFEFPSDAATDSDTKKIEGGKMPGLSETVGTSTPILAADAENKNSNDPLPVAAKDSSIIEEAKEHNVCVMEIDEFTPSNHTGTEAPDEKDSLSPNEEVPNMMETVKIANSDSAVDMAESSEGANNLAVELDVASDPDQQSKSLEEGNKQDGKEEVKEEDGKEEVKEEDVKEKVNEEDGKEEVKEKDGKEDLKEEDGKEEGEVQTDSSISSENNNVVKVEDTDDYLMYLETILTKIHKAYYDLYDDMVRNGKPGVPDVKNVIPYVRQKVLKGASIVFSGVIPTQVPLEKSKQYAVAVSLGAHVSSKIIPFPKPGVSPKPNEPRTTHVVAAREGTAKVNEARKRHKGIHIVTPDWLWQCAERWEWCDEKLFLLFKQSRVKRNPPPHCSSPDPSVKPSDSETTESIPGSSKDTKSQAGPSSSKGGNPAVRKERTPSGRFMDTINPLLTFSMDEIEKMDHEVDDIFNESDSSSTEDEAKPKKERMAPRRKKSITITPPIVISRDKTDEDESSSEPTDDSDTDIRGETTLLGKRKRSPTRTETETEDEPVSTRFRRGEPLPSDLDTLNLLSGSSDDDDERSKEEDQDDDWMAEALEREFLDENENSRDSM